MNRTKYLVYIKDDNEHSIVFPALESHDDIAIRMKAEGVLGAGFCSFDLNNDGILEIKCHGRSTSLNLEARPEDSLRVTVDYLGFGYEP